ncbi:predicted protein [Plenodomus lingam JN3]|uniref:Predicted protein n=1 Tax=Leptosphaeria maculans (strain JN3 / isolate v23.1.3 / race Av1-4-5-6-7-8) TaxID=985895 RepID=E4ZI43_LEPMJ|nr:predicted protein [Plenodomus lingam JN3]CBX91186.1 predicted protein [Plenodomus lingam JN3]
MSSFPGIFWNSEEGLGKEGIRSCDGDCSTEATTGKDMLIV